MFETIKNCFKVKEIRKKIFITLLLLLIFRLGCYIPVPGIDVDTFKSYINDGSFSFLEILTSITGGSLANATLFALGISPYINASIIIQLLTVGIPALERMSKQGEEGRKKIAQITRYVTIALAVAQAIGIVINFGMQSDAIKLSLFGHYANGSGISETGAKWIAGIFLTVVYTAGAMLVMWIGERITEYGISNGISLIIFIGIISTAGLTIVEKFKLAFTGTPSVLWELLGFAILTVLEFTAIVAVDLSERRIPVQYAKQVKGRKMYGGQSSVIPIRISGSGVMPLIFAFAIISFPQMIISLFWPDSSANAGLNEWFSATGAWYGQLIYMITLCVLIFAFAFFYQSMQFNPEDVSKNHSAERRFHSGHKTGQTYCRLSQKDIQQNNALRCDLSLACCVHSVAYLDDSSESSQRNGYGASVGILDYGYSHRGFGCVGALTKQLESQLNDENYKGFLK